MRWLIRTVIKKKQGAIAHNDDTYVGSNLTIGRAAGQGVFLSDLRAALEHARIIQARGGKYRVESMISAGVRVDGKLQQAAVVSPGSKIQIGSNEIRIINPPSGYDAAVEVTEIETSGDSPAARFADVKMSLADTWLGKRSLSWLLLAALLTIGLIIPVLGNVIPGLQGTLRAVPGVPDDGLWEAGTLDSAHHFFGEDCSTCHTDAFKQIRDENCTGCHSSTPDHASPELFALPEMAETRCASCHRDHNGLDGLIVTDQFLCQDCHDDLRATTADQTILANVSDFTHGHPEFKVELAAWDAQGNYSPRREALDSDTLIEDSNLRFPHEIHLRAEGLNTPEGTRVLDCDSCHEADAGGGLMKPVDFETMCQDCHRLGFDAQAIDRQVPHGKPAEVLYMLQDYYSGRALEGGYEDVTAPTVVRQRRRPGTRLTPAQTQEALSWARDKSRRVGENVFEGQACGVCHRVERQGQGTSMSWSVAPVRIAGVWFPKAHFPHSSHTTMACVSCHEAPESKFSDDVLMPDIDSCRTCHGGQHEKNKVVSTCVSCHSYHIYDGDDGGMAAKGN
jgi:hypothetical protein